MKNWFFLIFILVFAFFQATFLDYLKLFGVKPDLFFISVVIAAIYFRPRSALLISLFAGMIKDTLGISAFGINTLLMPVLSFLIIRLSKEITLDNLGAASILTFIAVLIFSFFFRLASFYSNNPLPFLAFLRISFFEALYTAAIYPLIFKVTSKAVYA
jgi:rod shape-determining protein MreD